MGKDKPKDEIYEIVTFIKDRMATKDDLAEVKTELAGVKDRLTAVEGKVDGVYNLIDQEVDKRKVLEVRTTKLEQKVFEKS